jgi:hypothetical protein
VPHAQAVQPSFESDHFYMAPEYRGFYEGAPLWWDAFDVDPFYSDTWYPSWPQTLPTRDMVRRALPEGVLQDGGFVTGFLYFQGVVGRENAVTLQLALVDAGSKSRFGHASVPLRAQTVTH